MTDNRLDLSRRKVLGSLGVVGTGAVLGGAGTAALFNDDENSEGNTMTAGTLNLELDWTKSYNGSEEDSYENVTQDLTDNPGPIFQLGDVKPGDSGEATISIHTFGNPAWVHMGGDLSMNFENSYNEPEGEVDDTTGEGNGELAQNILVNLWQEEDGDNEFDDNSGGTFEPDRMLYEEVTLHDLLTGGKLDQGILLDGDLSSSEDDCFPIDTDRYVGFEWWIPQDVGNEIQSDQVEFGLKFHAQQCRHNDSPNNPYYDQ